MSTSTENSLLFDSNILIIAHAPDHHHYEKARQLVTDAMDGTLDVTIAEQNLLEWYSTVTDQRRFRPILSVEQARKTLVTYRQSKFTIIRPSELTFDILWNFLAEHTRKGNRIYDLYLSATMLGHGISTIITENTKDFRTIPGITAINPFRS